MRAAELEGPLSLAEQVREPRLKRRKRLPRSLPIRGAGWNHVQFLPAQGHRTSHGRTRLRMEGLTLGSSAPSGPCTLLAPFSPSQAPVCKMKGKGSWPPPETLPLSAAILPYFPRPTYPPNPSALRKSLAAPPQSRRPALYFSHCLANDGEAELGNH